MKVLTDDLISRADAISAVEKYYNEKKYITRSRNILSAICEDMKSTIGSLPSAQRTGKWILLSEKIPEMDDRVVVTTHGYDFHIWDCMSNRGDDYFWEDEEGLYHNKYEVVAWLPLPEPYEVEE